MTLPYETATAGEKAKSSVICPMDDAPCYAPQCLASDECLAHPGWNGWMRCQVCRELYRFSWDPHDIRKAAGICPRHKQDELLP
jgi:hypothetical protein